MKKVMVTGGAGFIGSHTCKLLARRGYDVTVFDNLSTGHQTSVRWGELIVGDLADSSAIRRALENSGAQTIIHFAASAYVGDSMRNAREYFRNNVSGTMNLLDAMLDTGVREIVFSSSCATYGSPATRFIAEDHPQTPVNAYGETKLICEKTLRWYGAVHGIRSVCLRYFNAAGADPEGELGEEHDPEPHLIPRVIQAALGVGPAIEIFGGDYPTRDGTAVRDYVHVQDLACAHEKALLYLQNGGENLSLNLGTGCGYSVLELVKSVRDISGCAVPMRVAERRPGDPAELIADSSLAKRELGWRPDHSTIDMIVSTAWRWFARSRRLAASA